MPSTLRVAAYWYNKRRRPFVQVKRSQISRQMSLLEPAAPLPKQLNDTAYRELVIALAELLRSAAANANHVCHGDAGVDEDYISTFAPAGSCLRASVHRIPDDA